jgi:hypothetical protein
MTHIYWVVLKYKTSFILLTVCNRNTNSLVSLDVKASSIKSTRTKRRRVQLFAMGLNRWRTVGLLGIVYRNVLKSVMAIVPLRAGDWGAIQRLTRRWTRTICNYHWVLSLYLSIAFINSRSIYLTFVSILWTFFRLSLLSPIVSLTEILNIFLMFLDKVTSPAQFI